MANVLNAQVLVDGVHNYVLKYTGVLDTADLSAVTLVDVSGLNGAPTRVTIEKVEFSISDGLEVDLLGRHVGCSRDGAVRTGRDLRREFRRIPE